MGMCRTLLVTALVLTASALAAQRGLSPWWSALEDDVAIHELDPNQASDLGFTGVRFGIYDRNSITLDLGMSLDSASFRVRDRGAARTFLEDGDLGLDAGYGYGFSLRGTLGRFFGAVHAGLHTFESSPRTAGRDLFVGDVQLGTGSALDPSLSMSELGLEAGYAFLSTTHLMLGAGLRVDTVNAELDVAPGLSSSYSGTALSASAFGCWFMSSLFDLCFAASAGDRFSATAAIMWAGLGESWMLGLRATWYSLSFSESRTTPINGYATEGSFTLSGIGTAVVVSFAF